MTPAAKLDPRNQNFVWPERTGPDRSSQQSSGDQGFSRAATSCSRPISQSAARRCAGS
jgi:hypothetical protein